MNRTEEEEQLLKSQNGLENYCLNRFADLFSRVNNIEKHIKVVSSDQMKELDDYLERIEDKVNKVVQLAGYLQEVNKRLGKIEEMHEIWPCSGPPEVPATHP